MPNNNPSPKHGNPSSKANKDLSPDSKKKAPDATNDKKKTETQTLPKQNQTIAFDTALVPSPLSKHKLQTALTDNEFETSFPKIAFNKDVWVEWKVKELLEAFEKRRKAESSTSGFSAEVSSDDRWLAKQGTAHDLRYCLTQVFEKHGPIALMYKGHDALGRHWVSGWQWTSETSKQKVVVICVEEKKRDNKGAENDENQWVMVDEVKKEE